MFVHRSRLKTQGALAIAALLGTGLLSACDDPVANTDLRPEGDPEVLSVLVMDDAELFFLETATFCKVDDPKRPGLVAAGLSFIPLQICDEVGPDGEAGTADDLSMPAEPVTEAVPTAWYARIMFDELLDPDVEDLIEITEDDDADPATPEVGTGQFFGTLANTQPVVLTCGGNTIAYDGYYSPSGNAVTWPLGPSLFIQPVDYGTVATGSTCTLELKTTVVDKEGNPVPGDQLGKDGLYSWQVAALAFAGTSPAPADPGEEEVIAVDAPVVVSFNAFIDPATLDPATELEIREGADGDTDCANVTANGTVQTGVVAADADPQSLDITLAGGWIAGRMYAVTFLTNEVADLAGGPGSIPEQTICFVAE